MILKQDLEAAIAECNGKRNPDANTCIKLAAYLTIMKSMYPDKYSGFMDAESGFSGPVEYQSDTEFARAIKGRDATEIMPIIDELMSTIKVLMPRLYNGVMNKL